MGDTSIEWTDKTWNPIRGCSRVSEGCRNCYAEKVAYRFSDVGQAYHGLVGIGGKWNGQIKFIEEHLLDPLKWKKPQRIFVNSMSDLFHENVTDEWLDSIFAVMALCPQHTFQVLTKRPERMLAYLTDNNPRYTARRIFDAHDAIGNKYTFDCDIYWPLMNVQLGVSVENQKAADERIPLLLQTTAAVRFISAEPLLGPVKLRATHNDEFDMDFLTGELINVEPCESTYRMQHWPGLDWVIVGGESGPGARPMDTRWAQSLVDQCKDAGVAVFVKQLGGHVIQGGERRIKRNKKGNDMHEWPHELRVREFPAVTHG